MAFKGTVSYTHNKTLYVRLGANTEVKIQRLDSSFAVVSCVAADGQQVSISPNVVMEFMDHDSPVAHIDQPFIISWLESYRLPVGGTALFRLQSQKQHAIQGASDLLKRCVER